MLELIDIKKDYRVAGESVHALKGVSLKFRRNEFVSILGASGCGKTTLLNIIGGLDKYTSGDLVIEGRSTKEYKDGDWDTYRNHSVGFIFQSYHLIPHQTILQNVELALTISGISKDERRKRAVEALEKVGLADKLKNKPNQLSGGQAQRVAIARALINDPEIVLADEPTGALDSKTSVQIMELLKEISKDRLVIMVTHNPELAEKYSTRIIRLLDGEVTDDSMPFNGVEEAPAQPEEVSGEEAHLKSKGRKKKSSMSVGMAFGLSLKNLLSKGKRTAMVSFAGSIGIIGVSMVLAISAGVQGYIKDMENDMLSGYPLTVTHSALNYDALMDLAVSSGTKVNLSRLNDRVYVDSLLDTLMTLDSAETTNPITIDYKNYVSSMPKTYYNAIKYDYGYDMANYIYTDFDVDGTESRKMNVSVTGVRSMYTSVLEHEPKYEDYASLIGSVSTFGQIPDNTSYILSQYDVLATQSGKTKELSEGELTDIFESKDSLIMVVNNNEFSDLNFGQFGFMTEWEFLQFAYKAAKEDYDKDVVNKYNGKYGTEYSHFLNKKFTWYPTDTVYSKTTADDVFKLSDTNIVPGGNDYLAPYTYNVSSAGFSGEGKIDLKVKAILQKKKGVSYGCLSSGMYYTSALNEYTVETGMKSAFYEDIKDEQTQTIPNPTGKPVTLLREAGTVNMLPYNYDYYYFENGTPEKGTACSAFTGSVDMMGMMTGGSIDMSKLMKIDANMLAFSNVPTAFAIYPTDFETKDKVTSYLDGWNDLCKKGGEYKWTEGEGENAVEHSVTLSEADKITYTDTVGLIIAMVNTMIQMITIALIAFTALSLVVSTVMVGIITYVSVVERIKEIGILRAVGARKKDIKRLFNAETLIIGLAAGIVGIAVTYILSLILNLIIGGLAGIYTIAALPWWQALIMVGVSVCLTLISGLIPASAAAKKDPVVALRTE